jgi:hypothetical protein
MTYDHNTASPEGAPNAPIEWIEDQYVLHISDVELRIMWEINLPLPGKNYWWD